MPNCVFCDIVSETSPAHVVYKDDVTTAFLDTRPLFPGHVLLVPNAHTQTLPDLDPEQLPQFFANVQLLSQAVPLAMDAEGSFVAMNNKVSQSVPHLHCHIVPRNRKDGLRGFFWPRNGYDSDEHATTTRDRISETIKQIIPVGRPDPTTNGDGVG